MTAKHRTLHRALARAGGLMLGLAADRFFGDPPNSLHPVAWFGRWAGTLEKFGYQDSRTGGVAFAATATAPLVVLAVPIERLSHRHLMTYCAATALVTWAVIGAKSLHDEGQEMADRLADSDLAGARQQLPHLCGRDADALDADELARATVESLAENTSDAVVGSLFWGSLAGIPGLIAHRCLNTLDAMVGHHNDRYENFGWASAKLDDLANLAPARFTGALACLLASSVGGDPRTAWQIMVRDGKNHPSPNGGWCESAFAGALGVRLGGRNLYYNGRVQDRGYLGDGPRPSFVEVRKAARLVKNLSWCAGVLCGGTLVASKLRREK